MHLATRRPPPSRALLPALILALPPALSACAPPPADEAVEFRIPVEAAEVAVGVVEDVLLCTGTLRAREIVRLAIETPGLLQVARDADGRRLGEGSAVRAGQTVVRVTGEDARLHARLDATRRSLELAEAQLARQRELFDARLAARDAVQQAEANYGNALHEYERSSLAAAKATLASPIDGTILRLARGADRTPLADGQLLSAGFVAAEIAPLGELIADVDLIGPELARVRAGLEARIRHYAFEDADLSGAVERLSPVMDPQSRTFRAEVAVGNAQGLLRPGMFVEVEVIVERRSDVNVVPREAIAQRGGRSIAFVLDGQRVSRREVLLGLGDDAQVEVREGLARGDRVVVRGLETLTDGARVRVIGA